MTDIKTKAFSGVKWTAISKTYQSVVAILQVAILTRFLSKEDFGVMGIALLLNSFCSIFVDMGMSAAAMHEQNLTKESFSSFYWFNLLSGVLLTLGLGLSAPLVAKYYHNEELIGIVSLTSLLIFIYSISSLQRTMQQKKMNFRFMCKVDMIASTLIILANIIMAINGFGVYSLVWSSLIGASFTALAYLWIAITKEKNILFHFKFSEIKDALRIGIYQVGSSSLDFFSREMDSFIISSFMSLELFGVYTLFKNITSRIYQVINPIVTNVLTPVFALMQDCKEKVSLSYIKSVEYLGFVNFLIYAMIAISSYSFITILYGASYVEYSFVLVCLALFYAFQSCGNPVGALLVGLGRTDKGFYWTIYRILFTAAYLSIASQFSLNIFVSLIFLTPQFTSFPSWWIMFKKITTISFSQYYMLSMKPFLMCTPFIPLFFLDRIIDSPYIGLPVVCLLFIIGYIGVNYYFRKDLCLSMISIVNKNFHKASKNGTAIIN